MVGDHVAALPLGVAPLPRDGVHEAAATPGCCLDDGADQAR